MALFLRFALNYMYLILFLISLCAARLFPRHIASTSFSSPGPRYASSQTFKQQFDTQLLKLTAEFSKLVAQDFLNGKLKDVPPDIRRIIEPALEIQGYFLLDKYCLEIKDVPRGSTKDTAATFLRAEAAKDWARHHFSAKVLPPSLQEQLTTYLVDILQFKMVSFCTFRTYALSQLAVDSYTQQNILGFIPSPFQQKIEVPVKKKLFWDWIGFLTFKTPVILVMDPVLRDHTPELDVWTAEELQEAGRRRKATVDGVAFGDAVWNAF